MVKRTAIVPLLLLVLLINGIQCRDKIELNGTPVELMALVKSFASECLRRGVTVDISQESLQVGFGSITNKSGSCKPYSHPKIVTIDSMIWKALSIPVREMLVYHELAHCLLQRKHTNEVLPSGECKSWMRENDMMCKINSLNVKWRQYYIEELFSAEKLSSLSGMTTPKSGMLNSEMLHPVKIILAESDRLLFDSLFFAGDDDWKIEVRIPEPKKVQGYLSITINEYTIHLVGFRTFADTTKSVFIKTIILDQFKFRQDKNILYTDTLRSPVMELQFSLRKIKQTVHVFFENDLRASIPFEKSFALSGYYFFERASAYVISVHSLECKR